jgi:molybdenum cofactor guanylyltransferase
MSSIKRSAIILVGGEARRANGQEKYFFQFQGKTFIERLVDSLRRVTDEIILVAKDREQCRRFDAIRGVRCITDIRPGLGPIGGLHAGVCEAKGDLIFVSACDMPCIDNAVVTYLFEAIGDADAAIPNWDKEMLEPLHAVYRRSTLIEYLRNHASLSLRPMIRSINTRYVPVDELRRFDPELRTFTNINKLEELDRINAMVAKKTGPGDNPRDPEKPDRTSQ